MKNEEGDQLCQWRWLALTPVALSVLLFSRLVEFTKIPVFNLRTRLSQISKFGHMPAPKESPKAQKIRKIVQEQPCTTCSTCCILKDLERTQTCC